MALPADSPARQLVETLISQQETALTELGLELGSQYQVSHAEQARLAAETANNAVSDQTIGELSRLMGQERLTEAKKRANLNTSDKSVFVDSDVQQEYDRLQKLGVMRLPSFAEFVDIQSRNSSEYQKLICRYQNLTGARPWSAVEFNPETIEDHFARHMSGVGVSTIEEYAEAAIAFVNDSTDKESFVDGEGTKRFFDVKTGYIASVYPDGTIRTCFNPKNPKKYWEGQVKKYGTEI